MSDNTSNDRREFLKTTVKGGLVLGIGMSSLGSVISSCSATKLAAAVTSKMKMGFDQKPLPYGFNALENVIDANTMEIHYSKHAAGYTKNLKDAVAAENVGSVSLEEVLANISKYSTKMRNNAGGHYNHEMFWQCMRPKQNNNLPTGDLKNAIDLTFSSFENMKKQFSDAAKNRFGSGWAWLYVNNAKNLNIGSTPNQDNPLMGVSEIKGFPILGLDVWEHAYYLKYQNKRADYVDNWWSLVNWDYVSERWKSIV